MMVIAPNEVHSLQDLEGKHVGIDLPGEGTFVTAQTVFNQYDIHSTFDYAARQIALEKLKQGTLDAVIILASKPYDPVQNFDSDHRFHLVPVPYDNSFGTHYLPTSLTVTDYPNLIAWFRSRLRGRQRRGCAQARFPRQHPPAPKRCR